MSASTNRFLAAAGLLAIAGGLALVDRGGPAGAPRAEGAAPAWARAVEAGEDHLSAAEFVHRLVEAPGSFLVIDVRPADEFAAFHLPGSVRLDLVRLLGPEGEALLDANASRTVVLVSNGMTHPGQAWVELARRGHTNVRILDDGLDGLRAAYLTPPSLRGPTTETRARAEGALYRALSERVLGKRAMPWVSLSGRYATDPEALVEPSIVSAKWVAARLGRLVLLDARWDSFDFTNGHLPGAIHVPTYATRETRAGGLEDLLPLDALTAKAGTWGLTPDSEVVVYGGDRLQDATHLVMALVTLGHRKVALMEGGLGAWKAEGRALSTLAPTPTPTHFVPVVNAPVVTVGLDEVVAATKEASTKTARPRILDVRSTAEFEARQGTARVGGHIPTSIDRPFSEDVVAENGGVYWKARADLDKDYAALGLAADVPVIVTCDSGLRASQTWFTLKVVLGFKDVRWFDGSWQTWSAHAELPVESGPAGKEIR